MPATLALILSGPPLSRSPCPVHSPDLPDHHAARPLLARARHWPHNARPDTPRTMPERARAPSWMRQSARRAVASVHPCKPTSASSALTTPASPWTCSLACGGPIAVAMIQPLPHPYCEDGNDASTLSSPIRCPIKRVVTAMMPASTRSHRLAPSCPEQPSPSTTSTAPTAHARHYK
jgi:hypothetical protein